MKFTNLSDFELDRAVAEHVAGYMWREERGGAWFVKSDDPDPYKWVRVQGPLGRDIALEGGFQFSASVDAVLPLLERREWRSECIRTNGSPTGRHYNVEIDGNVYGLYFRSGWHPTLARAISVALLRAAGHEVT